MAEQPIHRPDAHVEPSRQDDDDQKIFDIVVGPNLRLRDNLIQLAAIAAGTVLGVAGGRFVAWSKGLGAVDQAIALVLAGFAGLLVSLFLPGLIIGIIRTVLAGKR